MALEVKFPQISGKGRQGLEKLRIYGGKPLVGRVKISGAKNAAVAILPAALLVMINVLSIICLI